MKCTECHSPMRVERTEETVRVAGRQFVGDLPALRCANGHVLIDGPGLEQFEREIAQHLARDRASADAFRFIRKANGLPAKTVAELFDVTPETVSRWESGALSCRDWPGPRSSR